MQFTTNTAVRRAWLRLKPLLFFTLSAWTLNLPAALPPAEQLLPADCFVLIGVPDWDKAGFIAAGTPLGQLWRDQEMKPFRDKTVAKFKTDIINPLERELGVKFADFIYLIHGQMTFAITRNGWDGGTNLSPAWLLLIDTKDSSALLKTNLANLRKKWGDAGKLIKTEKIRDLEFSALMTSDDDLLKALHNAFPGLKEDKPKTEPAAKKDRPANWQVLVGQSDSLLLIGNSPGSLEKVLARQAGGALPCLADQPEFMANQVLFRNAQIIAWINFTPLIAGLLHASKLDDSTRATSRFLPVRLDAFLEATGLDTLKTLSASLTGLPEGVFSQFVITLPDAHRKGLGKLFDFENKDAQPPPFVPIDAVKFSRWRLNVPKAWSTFESILGEISPDLGGVLQMVLRTAGKDKDPNFDFRKSLIDNLGDDFVSYQKPLRNPDSAATNSTPSLTLIGSPNAEALVRTLKTGIGSISPTNSLKEREFLGHKIYSVPAPRAFVQDDDDPSEHILNFAANDGYAAFSSDPAMIEDYLRSSDAKGRSLQETSGLIEAAQKVGGTATGFFGFENLRESLRAALASLKQDPTPLSKGLPLPPFPGGIMGKNDDKNRPPWFDLSLLPPFEKIGKYFYFLVYASSANPEGFSFKLFAPSPPNLKQ